MNTALTRLISRAMRSPSYWSRMIALGTTISPAVSTPCMARSASSTLKSSTHEISSENTV